MEYGVLNGILEQKKTFDINQRNSDSALSLVCDNALILVHQYKILIVGETGYRVYWNFLYSPFDFSVNLKLI